jgi:hypothetical protein
MAAQALAPESIALTEFEWRTCDVLASANRTIVTIAKNSKLALYHYSIVRQLGVLSSAERELLNLLHSDTAMVLEVASPEQLSPLADRIESSESKTREIIVTIRSMNLGFWERVYRPYLTKLEVCNEELLCYARSLRMASESALILLSKTDQMHLLTVLSNPPEPNEALRRALK